MGQYRRSLEIIADILSVVKGGARKTRIMYQANLSYRLLSRYLDFILESGLASVSSESECYYALTKKGIEFLEQYRKYSQRIRDVEEQMKNVRKERAMLENMCILETTNSELRNILRRNKEE